MDKLNIDLINTIFNTRRLMLSKLFQITELNRFDITHDLENIHE